MRLSFKAKLSLWHMVAAALILAVAAFGADWAMSRVVQDRVIDEPLLALAETEAAAAQADPKQPIRVHEVTPGTAPPSFVRLDKFVQIIDLDGHVVARSANLGTARLPTSAPLLARLSGGESVFETRDDFGEEPVRLVSVPVVIGGVRYAIQVATSLDDAYAVLRAARVLFLSMSLLILTGVGLTGMLLARKAMEPIDRVVTRARLIGESSLSERLPHPGRRDEIGRLVETLNEMLMRIEQSFEAQRRFTADASHELRSPLSRLRAELEVTLRRPRDSAEYEEALRSCLEEVNRLCHLAEDLLTLARLDAGEGREMPEQPVVLAPLLEDALERLAPEADRRRVTMILEPSRALTIKMTPVAARVVLANVLQNALKFSPPGGRVVVGVDVDEKDAIVAVSDAGPGVGAEERARIFDRFYRGDTSRSADSPGVGLGLAICRALLQAQGGQISVASTPGEGAKFSIRFPLAG
jgi:two-component system OmpR family sensor kinase